MSACCRGPSRRPQPRPSRPPRRRRRLAPEASAEAVALRLLARREHTRRELARKLAQRGFTPGEIDPALASLQRQGYQSDVRFAAAWADERARKGYGALRIRAELAERGVVREEIERALAEHSSGWDAALRQACRARFGEQPPPDRREWLKRARFLSARGFESERIQRLLGDQG